MIPDSYVAVPVLPLTVNGKLDRAALPAPPVNQAGAGQEPLTEAEQRTARLWSAVLRRQVTDPDADLFELGGHSITAARIAYELGVSVRTVFYHPTVRTLTAAMAAGEGARPAAVDGWQRQHAETM